MTKDLEYILILSVFLVYYVYIIWIDILNLCITYGLDSCHLSFSLTNIQKCPWIALNFILSTLKLSFNIDFVR